MFGADITILLNTARYNFRLCTVDELLFEKLLHIVHG